jgi:hypothetical protein
MIRRQNSSESDRAFRARKRRFSSQSRATELAVAAAMPNTSGSSPVPPDTRPLLTFDDRVDALRQQFGFNQRRAAFLTTVMLHAGVCLPRQYTAFAGITFGHTTRDFFADLVKRRFATAYQTWRRGGTLYHVHHKGLYRAIGEPDDRHRRKLFISSAVKRLMLLDVVLADRELQWLATARDKVAYFSSQSVPVDALPAGVLRRGPLRVPQYFPEKFPIGLRPGSDDATFVFLATTATVAETRRFLVRNRALFEHLPRLRLRLVVPRVLPLQEECERTARSFFADPPIREVVLVEFRRYCEVCRDRRMAQALGLTPQRIALFQRAFAGPRFGEAYRSWLTKGDVALDVLRSSRLHDAWHAGNIRIETLVLRSNYLHLERNVTIA